MLARQCTFGRRVRVGLFLADREKLANTDVDASDSLHQRTIGFAGFVATPVL
jgi:hypothetical protein